MVVEVWLGQCTSLASDLCKLRLAVVLSLVSQPQTLVVSGQRSLDPGVCICGSKNITYYHIVL